MSRIKKLEELYKELFSSKPITLFVAPRIRYTYKKSDYLYLFYRDLLDSPDYNIFDVSAIGHLKFVLHQLVKGNCILHYHWIQFSGFWSGLGYLFKMLCVYLYVKSGGTLIWSLHNKMPPDCKHEWLHKKNRKWLAREADRLVIECESAINDVSEFFGVPKEKFRVISHPGYPPQLMPRAAAIEAINHRYQVQIKIQDRIFLMFGHISSYKQIDNVCEMFVDESPHKKLLVVGPVKKGQMTFYKRVRRLIRNQDNIILIPQFIREAHVPEFMNAADFVIFNYRDVLASGGVPLAKSYDRTIILPKKGCLAEKKEDNLKFFESQDQLREIIKEL